MTKNSFEAEVTRKATKVNVATIRIQLCKIYQGLFI